jgi:hypothetical protein
MHEIKINNFNKSHHGIEFPWYKALSPNDLEVLQKKLKSKLLLDANTDLLRLVKIMASKSSVILGIDAEDISFSLIELLKNQAIKPQSNVLINWYRFDEIDEIDINDLNKYFSDIWYPSADDIDIFDSTLSWFLSISHSGEITKIILKE